MPKTGPIWSRRGSVRALTYHRHSQGRMLLVDTPRTLVDEAVLFHLFCLFTTRRQDLRSTRNDVFFPTQSLRLQGETAVRKATCCCAHQPQHPARGCTRSGFYGRIRSPAICHLRAPTALFSKGIKGHLQRPTLPTRQLTDCPTHSTTQPAAPRGRGVTPLTPSPEAGWCWRTDRV